MSTPVAPASPSSRDDATFVSADERDEAAGTVAPKGVDDHKETGSEKGAGGLGADPESGASAPPAIDEFPEGGLQAWLCVLGSFLVLFSTFGYINAFGVYQNWYQLNQLSGESPSNISWIGSIQLWLQFSMGAVAGPLFDKGYFRHLLAVGSVLYVFSLFMTSLCTKYWQFILAQGVLSGLSMGLLFLPAISVLSHYFRRRRALAMGLTVTGSSFGGIIFPIMLNRLFVSQGFANGVRASAYLVLGCLVIANLIMKPRLPGRKAGVKPPSPLVFFSEPKYALAVAGAFFTAWGLFFPFFYLQVFAEANHVSEDIAFYSLAILNAASVFGRTIPNAMADSYGSMNLIIPCCLASSVLTFAMFGATSAGGVIAFAIIFGFFSGGYVSLLSPVFISMSKSMGEIGVRVGYAFIVVGLAGLTGTPIAGQLLLVYGFYAPIIFAGVSIGVGGALLAVSRTLHSRDKKTWKV